ncbi:MAG: hypothetical protein B7X99_01355 [Rhizobiales bacterium 17-65-6]|nr:MAG: hypothetical protein B7Z30_17785 [Rhizobiales bacterium 12-68-15]OZA01259.1 MAG: hypothetical protein B7X99_01355 [Rhizobiales bacterium 17-65-6]
MNRFKLMASALVALSLIAATGAQAQTCLEQIVALQARVKAVSPDPKPPTEAQSVGAQLDRQPTPASIAAASGGTPAPVGPAAALNAAQNFQAAGDEASCLKAVGEARAMLEGK